MPVGPAATRDEIDAFRLLIEARPTATSPSRRWRCPPAPPWSKRASPRAISTCAPSCWSASACVDLLIYERDSLDVRREKRIEAGDEYFRKLSSSSWSDALRPAFARIEEFKL